MAIICENLAVEYSLTRHVRQTAGDVAVVEPLHEAVEEAVVLGVGEVAVARVAAVVKGPNLKH